jgi:mRNA-degrading endonuclease RelE of RelBE toxin-antitoxin system
MLMWTIEWQKKAKKNFLGLDSSIRKRIIDAVNQKLLKNPNLYLVPLLGDKAGLYKFRVGNPDFSRAAQISNP